MDITNMLNSKGAAVATTVPSVDQQIQQQLAQANGHGVSETTSERGNSPHGSEHSSRYSGPVLGQINGLNGINGMGATMRYPSPTAMQSSHPILQGYRPENGFDSNVLQAQDPSRIRGRQSSSDTTTQKAFPCSSCGKGFARRSDLARHERIHSGVRPHVCDHPGCNKQFIQRSALTVHARVHTGEKPHMCERCGKPFSDSSSLARHRRIHSGKRPYKCPYADCQKTFTRRTTLTRHQNHHTGTVEEAAAATAAALATRAGARGGRQAREDGEQYSNNGSPGSTPSPGRRNTSVSPNSDLAPMNNIHRHSHSHTADFPYMNSSSLPAHLRGDYHIPNQSPHQHQQPPTTTSYSNGIRPTSHPISYGPPPTLEPPANPPSSGSASGSPHMGSVGWHSPSHIPSPTSQSNGYVYPDPDPYGNPPPLSHIYYPNNSVRRPQSTEPDNYETKPRMNELWTTAQ